MYCPLNMLEVRETHWQGHNPYVTKANVEQLDLANGGGYRFTGAPPQFRPVVSYEAGRAPLIINQISANSNGSTANGNLPSQPRRGLFRFFTGR